LISTAENLITCTIIESSLPIPKYVFSHIEISY